jgi:hypothetical protein
VAPEKPPSAPARLEGGLEGTEGAPKTPRPASVPADLTVLASGLTDNQASAALRLNTASFDGA